MRIVESKLGMSCSHGPTGVCLWATKGETDEIGLIKTDENLMSSMKGVFVAGDIRSGATMQVASAVGEGATAALKIREYLEGHVNIQLEV